MSYLEKIKKLLIDHTRIEIKLTRESVNEFIKLIIEYCDEEHHWNETWREQIKDGSIENMIYLYLEYNLDSGCLEMTQTCDEKYRDECAPSFEAHEFFNLRKYKKRKLNI